MRLTGTQDQFGRKASMTFTENEIFNLVKSPHGSNGRSVAKILFMEYVTKQRKFLFNDYSGFKVKEGEYGNIIHFDVDGEIYPIKDVINRLKESLKESLKADCKST